MAASGFVPIVEPVTAKLDDLKRALDALTENGCSSFVIVNSRHGKNRPTTPAVESLLQQYPNASTGSPAMALTASTSLADVLAFLTRHQGRRVALIHAGFTNGPALAQQVTNFQGDLTHVFEDKKTDSLYRQSFLSGTRVIVADGFTRTNNRDYPDVEQFSSLHLTYQNDGFDGFGDYLIQGDYFQDGGGGAYAVAIHLTCIDPNDQDRMHIRHFVSDDNETRADPGAKFDQAVAKLVAHVNSPASYVLSTAGLDSFLRCAAGPHYPGLGSLKRYSMNHHIETLANYP